MREHCPEVSLLFISGYPRAHLEAHHLFDPTVPMLRKPFLPSRLLEAVEEALADTAIKHRAVEGS
jgi:FixJ family two-component response regulator